MTAYPRANGGMDLIYPCVDPPGGGDLFSIVLKVWGDGRKKGKKMPRHEKEAHGLCPVWWEALAPSGWRVARLHTCGTGLFMPRRQKDGDETCLDHGGNGGYCGDEATRDAGLAVISPKQSQFSSSLSLSRQAVQEQVRSSLCALLALLT